MIRFDWSPLLLSLRSALLATGIVFVIGTFLGWVSTRLPKSWRILADAILILPLVLPPTVAGFFMLWLFGQQSPVGRFLINILDVRLIFSWPATVIASGIVALPLMYRAARSSFELLDPVFIHAARTLGLSEKDIFLTIQLPLAWPGLAGGLVLSFTRALGEFGATIMIAGNIPGRTRTLSLAIYDAVQQGNYDQALIWSLILVGLSWVLILLINRYSPFWQRKQRCQNLFRHKKDVGRYES